ncbi:ATP-binding cassette domain-containing protein [Leptolyngbya sp. FACHB-321]|uniref:ATP-binding cassette domain-containing protein n=1 Tax=Leptolyngbya sp. FACHB-321 TaxID=2692807 RepID=UPI0016872923|nr:ATP-binding cassette domain-containing protein [Leptolyngbya sp. FACHB-321]MBD2037941.1 ATP-binding cassette domain-containing protein [Leptolyngbya sp. FACHB-321]
MHTARTNQLDVKQVSLASGIIASAKHRQRSTVFAETHYLLKDISFETVQGDRIAIVGASGSGKTSLLRLLNRLSEPTSGVILFNQKALTQIPTLTLRQQIVLVLQESKLLGMTVQQALEYPLVLRQLPKQAIRERVQKWSDRLHIPSAWLSRTELQLSVGQRQLVAIVRALVTEPSVLLLDEPMSALDVGRSELLLNVFRDTTQVNGMTVLMVNHQLELAEQGCDRVLYLEQGRLLQDIPATQMDWQALRQALVQAEAQEAEEWS